MNKAYCVYVMTNFNGVLYIGMTSNLSQRALQHALSDRGTFVGKYRVWKLIYVESYDDPMTAIKREKQLKGWRREKKLDLVARSNPKFEEIVLS